MANINGQDIVSGLDLSNANWIATDEIDNEQNIPTPARASANGQDIVSGLDKRDIADLSKAKPLDSDSDIPDFNKVKFVDEDEENDLSGTNEEENDVSPFSTCPDRYSVIKKYNELRKEILDRYKGDPYSHHKVTELAFLNKHRADALLLTDTADSTSPSFKHEASMTMYKEEKIVYDKAVKMSALPIQVQNIDDGFHITSTGTIIL